MFVPLSKIESVYRQEVQKALGTRELSAALLVELSAALFQVLKVKNLTEMENNDMLLFQYGVYNYGDELGKHFSLDITRQFYRPSKERPYRLCFTLVYDPGQLSESNRYQRWNKDFPDTQSFVAHIKSTEGFKFAERALPKTYKMYLTNEPE